MKAPVSGFSPETPAQNSIQSGIGLIQGWVCDAQIVEVQFDNNPKTPVAYGSSREDTSAICGDANNGYGMVMAWGLLTKGSHRMKTFIDGIEVSDVTFEVSGLDDAFVAGLAHPQEIQNFPSSGESVTIEWRESAQNFIIIEQK